MYCRRIYLKYLASIKSVIVSVRRCPVAALTRAPPSQAPVKLDIMKWCGTTEPFLKPEPVPGTAANCKIEGRGSARRRRRRPGGYRLVLHPPLGAQL